MFVSNKEYLSVLVPVWFLMGLCWRWPTGLTQRLEFTKSTLKQEMKGSMYYDMFVTFSGFLIRVEVRY